MSLAFWYYLIAISESLRDMLTTASRLSLAAIILCAFLLGLKIAFSLDNDLSAYLADKTSLKRRKSNLKLLLRHQMLLQ